MVTSSAQYSQIVAVVGKPAADVLIGYIESKVVPINLAVTALQSVAAPLERAGYSVTRALNADFVVNSVRASEVSYTVETSTAATGAGANDSEALVELMIDGVAAHSARNRIVATLTSILGLLGISLTSNVQRWVLSGYVPAGSTVNITTSGTGTASLISAQEVLL